MTLKYHKTLTEDKWRSFGFSRQILMAANELNRAKNWLEKEDFLEVKLCYERAFELLCLTATVLRDAARLRELLRFKEMLGITYLKNRPTKEENISLLKVLISLDKDSFLALNGMV